MTGDQREGPERSEGPPLSVRVDRPVGRSRFAEGSATRLARSAAHDAPLHCGRGDCAATVDFLVTFTLPAELRPLAWQHQRLVYDLLMDCAWQTLRTFSQNHRHLRGTPGAISVLHTHARDLHYHPHVHLVIPGAALDTDQRLWRALPAGAKYLFNHKALAMVFRGKFLAALHEHGLIAPAALPDKWVVDCKRVGDGRKALVYQSTTHLGRYLYRGVIQEHDILGLRGRQRHLSLARRQDRQDPTAHRQRRHLRGCARPPKRSNGDRQSPAQGHSSQRQLQSRRIDRHDRLRAHHQREPCADVSRASTPPLLIPGLSNGRFRSRLASLSRSNLTR
jgi:hypothetical protein